MFITTCFIRKNTPELRGKLGKMGYDVCHCTEGATAVFLMALLGEVHAVCDEDVGMFLDDVKSGKSKLIDCGDDEQLFLALAAMRDDTDKDQLFTNGIDWAWFRDDTYKGGFAGFEFYYLQRYFERPLHKATREEIMNCFQTPTV